MFYYKLEPHDLHNKTLDINIKVMNIKKFIRIGYSKKWEKCDRENE